jgi:hypothetical protein
MLLYIIMGVDMRLGNRVVQYTVVGQLFGVKHQAHFPPLLRDGHLLNLYVVNNERGTNYNNQFNISIRLSYDNSQTKSIEPLYKSPHASPVPHPHSHPNQPSLHLLRQTHVPTRHFMHKPLRRVKKHNMEMFDRMHALQRPPITEPNHILLSANAAKRPPNKAIQLSSRLRQQIIGHSV